MRALLVLVVFTVAGYIGLRYSPKTPEGPTPLPMSTPADTSYTAKFEIYTNGTRRIFSDSRYHNLSPVVYLTEEEPSTIHVEEKGITWSDFFATLPMQLNKNCLITGTKQTFCSNDTQKLKFFINEAEIPDALELEIGENETLRVVYE